MGPEEPRDGRRLAAIFAADVAGYSRLMGRDEAGTVRALSAARATLGSLIAAHGGRLVNTVGDSALAEFPSVVDAVKCAMAVQERLAGTDAESAEGLNLRFRIAVHVGDVLATGSDIYGDGVNVCARLQEVAEPGGICVSGAAYQYVRKVLSVAFEDLGERTLKNMDEPVRAFAVRPAKEVLRQAGSGVARAQPAVRAAVQSIAVLPFANLSSDPEQEFFSDGMTEEITAALAKIPDLRVVARTSAFQFKGQNQDLRVVGQALGAKHLIEGSVRKAGARVRITAQLIRVDDGTHLWTESYDRQLADIFAIQDDIAQAIARALRVPLGLQHGETLVSNRDIDPVSYQQYLRARALFRARAVDEAIAVLEPVIARDPGYAPAWALLPLAYGLAREYNAVTVRRGSIEEQRAAWQNSADKIENAAREAVRLDPKRPGGYVGLADVQTQRGNWVAAESLYQHALALDPGDPETLDYYNQWLFLVGRVKDSLRLREQLRMLEPFVPIYKVGTAITLHADGQSEAAIRMLEAIPSDGGTLGERRSIFLAQARAAAGRYSEAANTLLAIPQDQNRTSRQSLIDAAMLLRAAPTKVDAPEDLPILEGDLIFAYLYAGAPDRVMDYYERTGESFGDWAPEFTPVRKTERFKAYVRKIGLVDYWRERGWPDLCRPMGAVDFVCD